MTRIGKSRSMVGTVAVAAVVLVVGSTGGAVAGGLVTSAKIKNNTIKSIDVRNNHLTGVDLKNGSVGAADLAAGTLAKAVTSPLPSGKTVRGTIGGLANNLTAGEEAAANSSLPVPASVALDDSHVAVNGSDEPPGACPGSAVAPTAAPGFVCIYPWYTDNVDALPRGYVWGSDVSANTRYGFQVNFYADVAGDAAIFANWAYTAP